MPFIKIQNTIRKLLPEWCFIAIYKAARGFYRLWRKALSNSYFHLSYVYLILIMDFKNAKKMRILSAIKPYTMVGNSGLLATYDIAREIEEKKLVGSFVECGVARGGCSALMAMVARNYNSHRKVYLFDSFEGLPEPTVHDISSVNASPGKNRSDSALARGHCLGTYEEVSRLLFDKFSLAEDEVIMIKGWFEQTLPKYKNDITRISFLRLDGDWYESTMQCLESMYDNVISGGYVLIDDYDLPGCENAVKEFLLKKGVQVEFIYDKRGGAYFVKP